MKKMPDERKLPKREIDKAFSLAREILSNRTGVLEESPHDYQCFTYTEPGVKLVFYPHRTSAWNYHIRVRDQGSKDKQKATRLMDKLDEESGNNCTFSRKL
ncbi:MAG: hypothetical protein GWN14_17420 [candidate division Zixibacteria bacterium]|nr:hypothetical protein [candidate division Zixibacteria bacterium]